MQLERDPRMPCRILEGESVSLETVESLLNSETSFGILWQYNAETVK